MSRFEGGVKYYTTGKAVVVVSFPEDDIKCQWCQFCRGETDLKRYRCRLTNKIIYNPFIGLDDQCPVKFKEE